MERTEMEKGGALTGGQAACFAPAPISIPPTASSLLIMPKR